MLDQQPAPAPQKSEQESEYYNEDELWKMMEVDESDYDGSNLDKSSRPSYLDLAGNSGSTPIVSRKPRFQFSGKCHMHNAVDRASHNSKEII